MLIVKVIGIILAVIGALGILVAFYHAFATGQVAGTAAPEDRGTVVGELLFAVIPLGFGLGLISLADRKMKKAK